MSFENISDKDVDRIEQVAEFIARYDLDWPAMMVLESFKPLRNIMGSMGRIYLFPLMDLFGIDDGLFQFVERKENLDQFIILIEKKKEQKKRIVAKIMANRKASENQVDKKGWRRFFPF